MSAKEEYEAWCADERDGSKRFKLPCLCTWAQRVRIGMSPLFRIRITSQISLMRMPPCTVRHFADAEGLVAHRADTAIESFQTVVIALAISRAQLAVQYCVSAYLGRKAHRSILTHLWQIPAITISCCFSITSLVIPPISNTSVNVKVRPPRLRALHIFDIQVALFYAGIGLEALVMALHFFKRFRRYFSTEVLAERYGAFTLIILYAESSPNSGRLSDEQR